MSTNEPMTQERLDAIKERVGGATRGPWAHDFLGNVDQVEVQPHAIGARIADNLVSGDADLIAHAPQDLADLLAEVERLRALTTVDKDMIERGARAFYEHPTPGVDASLRPNWDRIVAASPDVADSYRRHMTAALDAALGTGEDA